MPTQAQIDANRLNSRKSTGPTSPEGAARSSKNSTKHGLTGLTLVVSPEERDAYQTHVQSYMDHHKPTSQMHRQLIQQLADAHWSLHQVFVQQTNTMALMNAVAIEVSAEGSAQATAAALAPLTRQLNTLSIYEGRRRRAAKSIQEELAALELEISEARRIPNKPNAQPEIGSVCSAPQPGTLEAWQAEAEALLRQLESEVPPAEAAAIRREALKMAQK